LFGEPWVDDIDDSVDGDAGFSDIGSDDNFSALDPFLIRFGRLFEDSLLLMRRQSAIEWYDGNRSNFISQRFDFLLDFAASSFDFFLSSQEQ